MPVHIANPKKNFNFTIRIAGLNEWLAQKVTVPEVELEKVSHGDANHDVHTAGRAKFGNIMIEKISPATGPDNFVWDWIKQCQNALLGVGGLPSLYKRSGSIIHFSNDGLTPTDIWDCIGLWPTKVNGIELSRVTSENTIESIELSVDIPNKTL